MPKVQKEVIIKNEKGLHIRVASELVRVASQYQADLFLHKGDNQIDAKSIMSVLTLEGSYNSKILIVADGEDAEEAIIEIEKILIEQE